NAKRAESLLNCLLVAKPNLLILRQFRLCEQKPTYFDAVKSGVVSKQLVTETTWNMQRRRKQADNTKKTFRKGNLTVLTFNKVAETT
ncbi:hypothetical protein, partial [Vibrio parahaemolyticus]|uniref:hypothetical protein n=1 Tax=Vibrio parahaemolyticus TaxID=670 RepID=UPI001A8D2A5C